MSVSKHINIAQSSLPFTETDLGKIVVMIGVARDQNERASGAESSDIAEVFYG
jgi:hypothetical protein